MSKQIVQYLKVSLLVLQCSSFLFASNAWVSLMQTGEERLQAGRTQEALKYLFEAEKTSPGNLSPNLEKAAKARILLLIAEAYFDQAKVTEALDYSSRALVLYRGAGNQFLSQRLTCLATVALAHQKVGDFTGATKNFREILETIPNWQGPIGANTMEAWVQAAWFFLGLGQSAQTEELFQEMIQRSESSSERGIISQPLHGLASLYVTQKRYSEAEPLIRRSLNLATQPPLTQPVDIAARRLILAEALAGQKRMAEAEAEYGIALPILRRQTEPPLAMLGTGLHYLAMFRAQQGRFNEAIGYMEEASTILARWFTPDDPVMLRHQNEYLQVLRASGRKREAKAMRKALDQGRDSWQAQNPAMHTVDVRSFTHCTRNGFR